MKLLSSVIIFIIGLGVAECSGGSSNHSRGGSFKTNSILWKKGYKSNDYDSDASDFMDNVKNSTGMIGNLTKNEGKKTIKKFNEMESSGIFKNKGSEKVLNNISDDTNYVVKDVNNKVNKIGDNISKKAVKISKKVNENVNMVDGKVNNFKIELPELKVDPSKEFEADGKHINVDNLMNNFRVNFEADSPKKIPPKGDARLIKDGKSEVYKKPDKNFDNLVKKVFGGGKNRKKPKRYSNKGKELKFYRDNSIPMMLRKVIPPRGAKLPHLHFEYVEGNSICRCSCNI